MRFLNVKNMIKVSLLVIVTSVFIFISDCFAGDIGYYIYNNQERNITSIINSSQNIVNTYKYDAFGNTISETGSAANVYKYNGEQYEPGMGLIFLRNRYYDSTLGRFIAKDFILGTREDPQTFNPYVYCNDNPINNIDSSGLSWQDFKEGKYFGTAYGQDSLDYYAKITTNSNARWYEKSGAYVGGAFSALWLPKTWWQTTLTLGTAYIIRVIGPFAPRGLPPSLQKIRRFIRFDRPHHGKGWHWDGEWKNKFFGGPPGGGGGGGPSGNGSGGTTGGAYYNNLYPFLQEYNNKMSDYNFLYGNSGNNYGLLG